MRREERINDWIEWVNVGPPVIPSTSFNFHSIYWIEFSWIEGNDSGDILTVSSETKPATPIHSTNQFTEMKWNWWEWKELRQVKRGMNSINHFKRIDFISFIIITVSLT